MIESDLVNGMRFVANNLFAFGLTDFDSVTVITEAEVNEALFDIFFTMMDLSILQVPFVNFFVHHQSFSNTRVLTDASPEAFNAVYTATGCETFDCLRFASTDVLLRVDQSHFVFTNEMERQIDRLIQFRAKYQFTFLLDEGSFTYPNTDSTFSEFSKAYLLENRDHPDKIEIMLDYFYRQKLPAGREELATSLKRAYYDFKVTSAVGSTLNATSYPQLIQRDTSSNSVTTLGDMVRLIIATDDFPTYDEEYKSCIRWQDDFNLQDAANCVVESIDFWNRVLPNVDAPYECHQPDPPSVKPSFKTDEDIMVTGRRITEFGRPGLNTYFGIPYAKAPVADLRFQRPMKPQPPVSDTIDAGLYKSECARNIQDLNYTSEDCLALDIWQPMDANWFDPKWTVIYFCDGYISLFGAAGNDVARTRCRNWMGYFTEDHDVISIHVNSRHGIFGYGTDLDSIPSNNGFADQEMALDWIYANLNALGGRPDMMVFVGQGFGGIAALLHAKKYKPTRVISSSASLNMKFPYSPDPAETASKIYSKLKCTSTLHECLSPLTTEQILSASQNVGEWPYGLVMDGELIHNLEMGDLLGVDMLLGLNTGDSFDWANDQYTRLNGRPMGVNYDPTEVLTDVIKNDFMQQADRSIEADLDLLEQYVPDAAGGDRNQLPLRETIINFYNDEGFWHPIYRAASQRDFSQQKTFVYKYGINSWYTDIERRFMVNSPKPLFAGAIRNDEADFVFKYFTSSPSDYYRYYDDEIMWDQDNVSMMWAQFIKTGVIKDDEAGFVASEFKNGHCVISIDHWEYLYMVRDISI